MANRRAALYLRSSKDRSDVSIAAQRRELTTLAADRGLEIVAEFSDAVESAKTEHRPGFQQMLAALRAHDRPWQTLLVLDTSRLSRRVTMAHVVKYEAEKRGVEIVFAKLPETDPITRVVMESVFQAFDEVHSLMSREKGLAGMRENVHGGWRAGGRAPWGYELEHIATGAMREGEAVKKSRLVPSRDALIAARYLRRRAAGEPRRAVARELGIDKAPSTLIGIEWNALLYAGHTVWNVHAERIHGGGYKGGRKRRPREEWVIQRDTHEALITEAEAEALLARLRDSDIGQRVSAAKAGANRYLLTGVLVTPDGRRWNGHRGEHYRVKANGDIRGRTVPRHELDQAVVGQLIEDLRSPEFAEQLLREARKRVDALESDPAGELRAELVRINGQISRAMDLAMQLDDPGPATRKVDELERQRREVAGEIDRLEREHQQAAAVARVTPAQVSRLLRERTEELLETDSTRLRPVIASLVDQVVLDPASLECTIHYRLQGEWQCMASPTGFDGLPPLELARRIGIVA